ncbi:hypothetical protein BJX99DRAFT_154544 [Aspergillus californicus]
MITRDIVPTISHAVVTSHGARCPLFSFPGRTQDRLFNVTYQHENIDADCIGGGQCAPNGGDLGLTV